MAIELFLKSKLYLVDGWEKYEFSHDVVNMYRHLKKRFLPKEELTSLITLCRKYFNEARYPHGDISIYTEVFAQEFLGCVNCVKDYIDNVCVATIDDLQSKYNK